MMSELSSILPFCSISVSNFSPNLDDFTSKYIQNQTTFPCHLLLPGLKLPSFPPGYCIASKLLSLLPLFMLPFVHSSTQSNFVKTADPVRSLCPEILSNLRMPVRLCTQSQT